MEITIFLTEKRNKLIKAQICANGSRQRIYMHKEEAISPAASTEAVLITVVIEVKKEWDVMTFDAPNDFVKTKVSEK